MPKSRCHIFKHCSPQFHEGGRGGITGALIKKHTRSYGGAIRDNVRNLDGMEYAIRAAFYHWI